MDTVTMPRLSDSMEEGTIIVWLKAHGKRVERGEDLVEIETDKASMAYESEFEGRVHHLAAKGDTVPVGAPIAWILAPDEAAPDTPATTPTAHQTTEDPRTSAAPLVATPRSDRSVASAQPVSASPIARRMARQRGLDLEQISGSGPGGRVVKADVEAAASAHGLPLGDDVTPRSGQPAASPDGATAGDTRPAAKRDAIGSPRAVKGDVTQKELTRAQAIVNQRMSQSKATAPDFQLVVEVDMSGCVRLREQLKHLSDPLPSFNDMIVKGAAIALRELPRVNGSYREGRWELYSRVNVGIAVAAEGGLVVPTLFDADRRSLREIAEEARRLIDAVRRNTITPADLAGGTFTVSNLGMHGIEWFSAIINPPQAAILAVGALKPKPMVDDERRIVVRESMAINLICDHRILYGADGARFLARLRQLLEQPLSLMH